MVVSFRGARRASQRRFAADAANTGLIARAAVPGGIPGRMDGFGIAAPVHFFPNVVREAEAMIFLYEGDACYESGDLTLQGPVHRTVGKGGRFYYEPLSEGA